MAVNGNTATLLSPTEKTGYNIYKDEMANAIDIINEALETWPSVNGISGVWRVPTETEARTFLVDENSGTTINNIYLYMDNNTLKTFTVKTRDTGRFVTSSVSIGINNWLRPVIDVTVE